MITHDCIDEQGPESEAIVPGLTGDFFKKGDVSSLAAVITKWIAKADEFEVTKKDCYAIVDKYYNPSYQQHIINSAVSGISADQLIVDTNNN